ncbi:methionyl-tRNA formyltransferase [Natronoglycomyces albus]|uniref:Methionyl-tRNA formyltransferase n=1 Tax=Natronoglycomyces albus TaxID=2811108 RepID=A0A895XVS1_9ACTN|nr:methionyl-tRNA formyltransferase [Natronoglycomyces albus]QSB06626.1 methionyl-tRNA formyltransferase [Natronoglycomyces albus]
MRLIFAGTPEVAIPSLDAIAASHHELAAVLTQPDARSGRGRKTRPSPVAQWAEDHRIEVLKPERVSDCLARIRELDVDCAPVVAYGNLVGQSALALPRLGWINLHFSLLPAWRGAAPVQHAVLAGDDMTGACVFQLERGLDTGPVFGQLTEPIAEADTSGSLLERLATAGARLLVDVLDGMEAGVLQAKPQSDQGVSHAPKLTTEDARIRWDQPAFAVDRRIRAVTPAPGAWTTLGDDRFGLGPIIVDPDGPKLAPGEASLGKKIIHVGTATDPVRLGEVKPAGKKLMPAAAWANGIRGSEVRFI